MFHIKESFALGALLLVSMVGADQPKCDDCIGDSLVSFIDQFDAHRECFFVTKSNVLLKEKIYTLEAIIDCLSIALSVNNDLTEEKCKSAVKPKVCSMEDKNERLECLVASERQLVLAHRNQELCHGKALKTEEMRVAARILMANLHGWKAIHPDC